MKGLDVFTIDQGKAKREEGGNQESDVGCVSLSALL